MLLRSVAAAAAVQAVQTQRQHQQQHNISSGTCGIAADSNFLYTPKLLREQDAYCTRIIALNPENKQ